MTKDASQEGHSPFSPEQPGTEYRRVSPLALVAVGLALVSPIALTTWLLWWVPCVAAFIALLALWSLRTDRRAKGRQITVVALAVALVIAAAAPTRFFARSKKLSAQAERAAVEWLEILQNSRRKDGVPNNWQLARAMQFRLPTDKRQPLDATLLEYYIKNEHNRYALEDFANERLVRTLHTLGTRATIRHYATESCTQSEGVDRVKLVCAVTFLRDSRPESFFVQLLLERKQGGDGEPGKWRVASYRGDYLPKGLSATG